MGLENQPLRRPSVDSSRRKATYFSEVKDIKRESVKERAERVGYVLQNPNQMISTNMIFDEVALGLRLGNVQRTDRLRSCPSSLKTCGLYEFRKWPISALSYGQKKAGDHRLYPCLGTRCFGLR